MVQYIDLGNKYGSSKDKALTPTERDLLFEKISNDKHRVILICGVYAGMRVQEIVQNRFTWLEWVVISGKKVLAINIPAEDKHNKNKKSIWRPKTKKARTTYIFENEIANELFFWYKNNPDGIQLERQTITTDIIKKHWSPLLAGKHFGAHALRSTAQNYFLYEKNFSPKFVAIVLGHADIRTTVKHYDSKTRASAEAYLAGL